MAETKPVVYLFFGDDEFALTRLVHRMETELGDSTMAEVNTTRLDGRSNSLDELVTAVHALPFLTPRRLVILSHPLSLTRSPASQKRFLEILDSAPDTTALVLLEYRRELTTEKERKANRIHWLERWSSQAGGRVYVHACVLPLGAQLVQWIQERARVAGGKFTPQAALALIELVGAEPRILDQEIQKLLLYVNYARPVDKEDVHNLTPSQAKNQDFALVNALRARDAAQATAVLHRELEEKDPIMIFQSIVYQLRLLLLTREIMNEGGRKEDVAQVLKISSYPAELAVQQARKFDLPSLESIYRRLLEMDVAIKTGEMQAPLALDLLILELTT